MNESRVFLCFIPLEPTLNNPSLSGLLQNPFTFGLLEQMLPKPPQEAFGSPQPYSYYPSHVFELPYTIKQQGDLEAKRSQCYTEYTVESFQSNASKCVLQYLNIPKGLLLYYRHNIYKTKTSKLQHLVHNSNMGGLIFLIS